MTVNENAEPKTKSRLLGSMLRIFSALASIALLLCGLAWLYAAYPTFGSPPLFCEVVSAAEFTEQSSWSPNRIFGDHSGNTVRFDNSRNVILAICNKPQNVGLLFRSPPERKGDEMPPMVIAWLSGETVNSETELQLERGHLSVAAPDGEHLVLPLVGQARDVFTTASHRAEAGVCVFAMLTPLLSADSQNQLQAFIDRNGVCGN
ncbi:hypothetical protein [Planctomicrobium piriforme]|uniref:Uncharacterized protein n=1 Tax=Planctomicrobium piriforme TaxID=1576369 RepID=A0A1I3KWV1_9PLAN|nr:hypothetical protein [Planctomicrobium piriforme]SFI77001.1 hypothetical protein SAMN05421753_11269 [Planctomicrobium piriforme]